MATTDITATFEIRRTTVNGASAILVVVRNARACPGLPELLDRLGVTPTPDIANHRSAICTTPEALDAVRAPLIPYLDQTAVVDGRAPFVRAIV